MTGYIWVDCDDDSIPYVKNKLDKIVSSLDRVKIDYYEDALRTGMFSIRIMKTAVYIFLIIIGLIGFMNMSNTIITSIIVRSKEFGVLQAIGMTNRQLNMML